MGRHLSLILAHPDDESYAAYGTVARHAQDEQFRLSVLHATDGEKGEIAHGVPVAPEDLGAWRRREDENAWCAVGAKPHRHDWLGLPDGGVEAVGIPALRHRIITFLREERPDVVATFGPDGVSGHPDHIAMSVATTEAFDVVRREPGPGLKRLLYTVIPQRLFEFSQRYRVQIGLEPWDPTQVYHLRGTADELIGVQVDNRDHGAAMLAAFREHRSQRRVLFDPDGSDEKWVKVMRFESWVVAWPQREPGAPLLDDVFAELD
ncbi:PIG-L deacetylase family protein [Luteipulveratus mongoliensis]|uniref:GlcNAc-PI de-N-acetylase n=1 Tax=Luteipulveratus mongoliensis TaxID=571913 RepID=A0A0K1JF83_9MICO|nr:PIG-L family deacetylase [Luteipulveratus mongoliensis]AKU15374.1 hypothetical protein VV02_05000 [Luteipulveratus mongoliensis]